jgi:hypothetical protein
MKYSAAGDDVKRIRLHRMRYYLIDPAEPIAKSGMRPPARRIPDQLI